MKKITKLILFVVIVAIITATFVPIALADTRGQDCSACGSGSLYRVTYTGSWYQYATRSCTHHLYGHDSLQRRLIQIYDKCNNCGAQFLYSQYYDTRTICHGY